MSKENKPKLFHRIIYIGFALLFAISSVAFTISVFLNSR